jgi:tRNA A-37 threonylcarbamoyl transferase component Bud32/tetratricopeptide (TPR) repeat protein
MAGSRIRYEERWRNTQGYGDATVAELARGTIAAMSAHSTAANVESGLSFSRDILQGVHGDQAGVLLRQATHDKGVVPALRSSGDAGSFGPIAGSGGRRESGIGLAAWLRKEALLLIGQQSGSEGDEEVPPERGPHTEDATGDPFLPRIDGYDLQRQIGRGGSATVYLARERKHQRLVAVKVLHPALAASLQAERFLREISIVANLAHPNILPLLDSGTSGDLLYYVTPYVPGESLRKRLERDGKLPVAEAVRLVREAADALDYAHRKDLVHRDVKPENILLADGHALLADFGIARAMRVALGEQLTAVGVAPGTLHYMSPEQADAKGVVDGRSDQYSLACVLYELLTGSPPFTGATLGEIAIKHAVGKVPPIQPATSVVPPSVKQAIQRALAKSPEARFASAAEFGATLGAPGNIALGAFLRGWQKERRVGVIAALVAAAAVVTLLVRFSATTDLLPLSTRALVALGIHSVRLDTTTYVAVGTGDAGAGLVDAATASMRGALNRWRDVVVADDSILLSPASRSRGAEFAKALRRAAYRLEAGRFVLVNLTNSSDSIRLLATLHDTRTGLTLGTAESRLPRNLGDLSAHVVALSDELLFRGAPPLRVMGRPGTTSLAARQLYLAGHSALANGDFAAADSAFSHATTVDPEYPQALVWLANVRSWMRRAAPWHELPPRAISRRSALNSGDSLLLDGLLALVAGDTAAACPRWQRLTKESPNDFAAWYGLGTCLRIDIAVVRDARVHGGWRFRSSKHQSVRAYEEAFRLRPNVLLGFGGRSLTELRRIMLTSGSFVVLSRAVAPDTQMFSGYRIWENDSLVILPLSGAQVPAGPGSFAMDEAVHKQRLRFRDVAHRWKGAYPRSPDAVEAVAIALEMLGDEAALDTLRLARNLARDPDDRLRMAINEVLMRVKFSAAPPQNLAGLRRSRELADSILTANPPAAGVGDGERLAALAALTGRATLAAAYSRLVEGDETLPALSRTGPALIAFASLGGPQDSLWALEAVVERGVQSLPESQRADARRNWLTRAALLGFPSGLMRTLPRAGNTGLRLGNAIASAVAGDTTDVLRRTAAITAERRFLRPADITTDGVFPVAAALVAVGALDTAISRLDPTLLSLQFTSSEDLSLVYRTGPLVRAMALRADLADSKGDSATARTWASAVTTLWANADPFLNPVLLRMRKLTQ